MKNLQNISAYITGGTKGIGYAVAESLMAEGANVTITSRSQQSAEEAAEQLDKKGLLGKALGVEADVRDMKSQQEAVTFGVKAFGKVNVIVANAGVWHFASIQELTAEEWQETIDVNLTGVFNSVKAGLDQLIEHKGYLLTIASLAGTNFFATGSAYNASKFGLVGFTQAVMMDVRSPKGVENQQHKGGIDIGHDTIRFRRRRLGQMLGKVNGERRHPRPAGGVTAGQRHRP